MKLSSSSSSGSLDSSLVLSTSDFALDVSVLVEGSTTTAVSMSSLSVVSSDFSALLDDRASFKRASSESRSKQSAYDTFLASSSAFICPIFIWSTSYLSPLSSSVFFPLSSPPFSASSPSFVSPFLASTSLLICASICSCTSICAKAGIQNKP